MLLPNISKLETVFDSHGRLDHWSLRMALTLFILFSLWYLLRMWERPTMQFDAFLICPACVRCVLCLRIAFAAMRIEGSLFKKRRPNSSHIQFIFWSHAVSFVLKQSAIFFVTISSEMQNWGSLKAKCS
jgi:hypothetical protein